MSSNSNNIASHFPLESHGLRFSLLLIGILLLVGLFSPIITLEKFYFFNNTVSIASGLVELVYEGQILLFIIILLFSVVLPIIKLLLLNLLLSPSIDDAANFKKYLMWMHRYGKWSMLDVFVVAVFLTTVKLGAVANVQLHYGLYLFAAAVLLTMLVTARVVKLSDQMLNT